MKTTTLAQRLKYARLKSGFEEVADAAKKAGITPSALYQLEDGKSKSLNGETAVKLSKVYKDFRVEWLIAGHLPDRYDKEKVSVHSHHETKHGYVRLSIMNIEASCGDGVINEDFPEVIREIEIAEWQLMQCLGFIPRDNRVQLITVRGDSMYPDIKHGDSLMVDVTRNFFDNDGLYMLNLHGFVYVKRLQLMLDGLHVISTNPKYSNAIVQPDEMDSLHITGKVVGMGFFRSSQEI